MGDINRLNRTLIQGLVIGVIIGVVVVGVPSYYAYNGHAGPSKTTTAVSSTPQYQLSFLTYLANAANSKTLVITQQISSLPEQTFANASITDHSYWTLQANRSGFLVVQVQNPSTNASIVSFQMMNGTSSGTVLYTNSIDLFPNGTAYFPVLAGTSAQVGVNAAVREASGAVVGLSNSATFTMSVFQTYNYFM